MLGSVHDAEAAPVPPKVEDGCGSRRLVGHVEGPAMSAASARLPLRLRNQVGAPVPLRRGGAEPPAPRPLTLEEVLAPARWIVPDRAHPELRKVLGALQAQVGETRRLLALPGRQDTPTREAAERELESLLQQDSLELPVDAAWELSGALKRFNLRLGDVAYLRSRLEYECNRSRTPGHWHGWDAHFDGGELEQLLAAYRAGNPSAAQQAHAVDRLTFLYLMREEAGRDRRARGALKCLYLGRLAVMLVALLAGLAVAVNSASDGGFWQTIVLSSCAGALGSTLSGVLKVRDQLTRLDELRGFWPAMRVQPFVGACAGLIVFLILDSHAVSFGSMDPPGWSSRGLLAFAAGFSEPFFLGLVQRVAVVPDPPAGEPKPVR
jgi:hypothetical protein